jgi:hypothetical protein
MFCFTASRGKLGLRGALSATVLSLGILALPGCGSRGPEIVDVTGTVTRGGEPVEDLEVHFVPDEGRPSWGLTDAQGRFTLNYSRDRDGAVVGRHRVFVRYMPHDPEIEFAISQGNYEFPAGIEAIEAKYGRLEDTPLEFELEDDAHLELKLD